MRRAQRNKTPLPLKVVAFIIAAVLVVTAVVVIVGGILALEGLVIWALWNALVPSLASGPSVTYVQGVLIGVALNIVGTLLGGATRVS